MSTIAELPYAVTVDAAQAGYPLDQVELRLTYGDRTTAAGPYNPDLATDDQYIWDPKIAVPGEWSVGYFGIDLGDGSDEEFIPVTAGDLGLPWPGVAGSPGTVGSFTAPTVDQVLQWTGINPEILKQDSADLSTQLQSLINLAMSETAIEVGEAAFTSENLTGNQIHILQQSVAYHAGASFLLCPMVRKLTGTHIPQLVESGGIIEDAARSLQSRAIELSVLFVNTYGGGSLADREVRMAINAARSVR